MKKGILVGLVMGMVAMGSAYATLGVNGDNEMLEGAEGHIVVFNLSADVIPKFDYISGAAVSIAVDPLRPRRANVVPNEVSANAESTIRITAGSETADHTFMVVNEVEPEQVNGKTIGQCMFYNDDQNHTGIAGVGAFAFDKRTVDNIDIAPDLFDIPDYTFLPVEKIISTTRKIDNFSFTGLTIFEDDGGLRLSSDINVDDLAGDMWYEGSDHQIGQATWTRYGTHLNPRLWTTESRDARHSFAFANFSFDFANESAAHGKWQVEYLFDPKAHGSGYFDCTISDEDEIRACGGSYTLPSNQWRQISLPCYSFRSKVSEVFANLPGTYDSDWMVYQYNKNHENKYTKLGIDDSLEQGKGYWIIQDSGETVTLTMPQGSIPTLVAQYPGCTEKKGCFEIPLATNNGNNQWTMVGFPFDTPSALSGARITTHSYGCNTRAGCTLDVAKSQDVVYNQLWGYVDEKSGYAKISPNDMLTPWLGYWSATLPSAEVAKPVKLVIPKP